MRRLLLALFAVLGAAALPAAPPATQASAVEPAAAASEQALKQALETAMAAYASRAAELLAVSDAPRERWIAGLMFSDEALRLTDATAAAAMRERGQALLRDAMAAGQDDATLLFWAILDPPMAPGADDSQLAQARLKLAQQLQQLEPDNAVVWLGALPARDTPGAIPVAIELLQKAAAAKRFDTHFAASMRMLIAAFARVPLPESWPDTSRLPGWEKVQPEDVHVIMAVGFASALAMPYLPAAQWWCDGNSAEQPWLDDCRKLALLMVEHSDSIVPRSMGLGLLAKLHTPDSAIAPRAIAMRRELAWLIENGLQRVGPGQPVGFGEWRRAWAKPDSTELSVARAMVKAQGLPLLPPEDFVPAWDRSEAKQ